MHAQIPKNIPLSKLTRAIPTPTYPVETADSMALAYLKAPENSIHKVFQQSLPNGTRYMFAYGSGVFKQTGHKDEKKNMLDYIIVADDCKQWHMDNLALNRSHYSFLKYGGPKFITDIQRGFGAGIYFNTLVKFDNRLVKYGVIATEDLKQDLLKWTTLYVSGRLHKPVMVIQDTDDLTFNRALMENLRSALKTAVLLLPDSFTDEELFLTISALSYKGDFRMLVGEDKNKVRNIVLPHMDKFQEVYRPVLRKSLEINCSANFRTFQQDCSPASRHILLAELPETLRERVIRSHLVGNRNKDTLVILQDVAHNANLSRVIEKGCKQIVSHSSWWQSVKGIFTAGILKSIRYSFSKVKKMVQGGKKIR